MIGLLHLGDLQVGYPWSRPRLPPLLEAMGWPMHGEPHERLDPPSPLAVVVPWHIAGRLLAAHRSWLRGASRLMIIRDVSGEDELLADPDLVGLLEEEQARDREILGSDRVLSWRWWDGSAESTRELADALRQQARLAPDEDAPRPTAEPSSSVVAPARPPGPWLDWTVESLGGLGALARSRCVYDGRPALLDGAEPLRLVDASTAETIRTGTGALRGATLSPDGRTVLGIGPGGLELGPLDGPRRPVAISHQSPICIDPGSGLGAVGTRCWFRWLRVRADEASVSTAVLHGWPCGHGKKLWGYMDNEPVRVETSPRRDAYLSVYDVDAIVGSRIMPRWRRAGPAWVPQWPPSDPHRALYTCPDWTYSDGERAARHLDDEDCRADAPAIALGPDARHRYAVGLDREVWRIRGETIEPVGGPDEGYVILDREHAEVRRAPGRLLCGRGTWLWVQSEGRVWREAIDTGERTALVEVDRPIDAALAFPGIANALLVRVIPKDDEEPDDDSVRRVPFFHERFSVRLV